MPNKVNKVNKVKKVKVTTTFNKDGSYTKTDGTTSSTYKPSDPHNPSEYTNEKGNKRYITLSSPNTFKKSGKIGDKDLGNWKATYKLGGRTYKS